MTPAEPFSSEALRAWLDAELPATCALLQRWVAVNSFTAHRDGVCAHGRQVADAFAPLGFTTTFQDAADPAHGAHLALHGGSTDPTAPIVGLVTHLDTVFTAEEEARENFRWSVEGDRAYGPGVNDIKGGTAMIWLVLRALRAFAPEVFARTHWVVLANAAEERLALDFTPFAIAHLGPAARACLILEAGAVAPANTFPLVVARKGRAEWSVAVEGRAAHAGADPARGANAVVQAAHLIPHLAQLADPARELSVNVASLAGGALTNRVPDHARIHGECRAFDPTVLDDALAGLRRACTLDAAGVPVVRSAVDGHACHARLDVSALASPWPENPRTDALFATWASAAATLGLTVTRERRGGLSDGNALSAVYPVLDGLGPAGGNSHCAGRSADGTKTPEFLLLSSIAPKALLNFHGLLHLLPLS